METREKTEQLYTAQEYASILKRFNIIYNILKSKFSYIFNSKFGLKNDSYIVNVQRGIIYGEENIFWDYLGATHNIIENIVGLSKQKGDNTVYRCIKLIFGGGESLILCTNSSPEDTPKGTLCLDEYYLKLKNSERDMYDNILRGVGEIEYKHFHSNGYGKEMDKIKSLSKDNIFTALNITKYNK